MADSIAAHKRAALKTKIAEAYNKYRSGESHSRDHLLELVRQFAYLKVYHLEFDFRSMGTAETADDWAQEVTIAVWQGLEKFASDSVNTSDKFYSWIHKIAFNQATDAFKYLDDQRKSKVGLMVTQSDDRGAYEVDNPEIYEANAWEDRYPIPLGIEGVELEILESMLTGVPASRVGKDGQTEYYTRTKTYKEVGEELRMEEGAVKMRLLRLRKRMKTERKSKAEAQRASRSGPDQMAAD